RRRSQPAAAQAVWRRPKDLAGSTWGLDQCRVASPAITEARSFGRAQAVEYLQVPEARSLRKSILGYLKDQILKHTLRLRGTVFSGFGMMMVIPAALLGWISAFIIP
ncbi:MAG TPA: hypothetical protein VEQ60_00250, partial [Longimicrobium sp.]|nr:hypothetical protein [Longimicrobium sp.]